MRIQLGGYYLEIAFSVRWWVVGIALLILLLCRPG